MRFSNGYEHFILNNAHQVATVESALRSFTYILPGRFGDAELASEVLFATLNLLGLYHDTIILRALRSGTATTTAATAATSASDGGVAQRETSSYNRYTRCRIDASATYRRVAKLLTLVQGVQVLLEMVAKRRWGDRGRWRMVASLEALKTVGRLCLFRLSKQRLQLHATWPERDIDPNSIVVSDPTEHPTSSTSSHDPQISSTFYPPSLGSPKTWRGARTGHEHRHISDLSSTGLPDINSSPSLIGVASPSSSDITAFLLTKVLTPDSARRPGDLIPPNTFEKMRSVGELVFLLRPLVYVLSLRKYGPSSWRPWMLGLIMELMSRSMHRWGNGAREMTALEKNEIKRRKWLLLYYLLRNPFYDKFTRDRLDTFCEKASQRALLSLFAGIIRDYKPLWEGTYFYTSAS